MVLRSYLFPFPLDSVWAFWDLNKNHKPFHYKRNCRIYGCRAWFEGRISFFVHKILFKKAILAAHRAKFGHFGI